MENFHDILREAGLIESTGNFLIRSETPVDHAQASSLHEKLQQRYPQHKSELQLLRLTCLNLPKILTGAISPIQVLFGNRENKAVLEDVYTNGPMYAAITKLLGKFLTSTFQACNKGGDRIFRILELGAGTGGTTKYVLDRLAERHINASTCSQTSPNLL